MDGSAPAGLPAGRLPGWRAVTRAAGGGGGPGPRWRGDRDEPCRTVGGRRYRPGGGGTFVSRVFQDRPRRCRRSWEQPVAAFWRPCSDRHGNARIRVNPDGTGRPAASLPTMPLVSSPETASSRSPAPRTSASLPAPSRPSWLAPPRSNTRAHRGHLTRQRHHAGFAAPACSAGHRRDR